MNSEPIQKNDVFIEQCGHGKFEGFRFYAHKNNTDKTTKEQDILSDDDLISAFSQRAARFCASANADFAISSDGIIRWIGQAVGKLTPTEDILMPSFILLADTQLTGESRDNVIIRLERFVAFHFETALKSLFDLRNAHHLTGLTRDIALQLVSSLGIIPRRKIANIVKNIDQQSRAELRQFGVRFGALHIYVIPLIKPIPAQAITLLWTLKNERCDTTGLSEILAALSAGRTSLITDTTYNPQLYSLIGYQILGKRAVRIDILERLSNLIRLALNWKPGINPKPEGAYDGKRFFITPTMMSILGAKEADMEEILKGLGYQSQPCDLTLLNNDSSVQQLHIQNAKTEHNCPEAECVGDLWKDIALLNMAQEQALNKTQKDKILPSHSQESLNFENFVPEAELIGDFAKQKQSASESKIVLLWRYQYRNTRHSYGNHSRSRKKPQDKHVRTFKDKKNTTNGTPFQKNTEYTKKTRRTGPTYSESSHKKSSPMRNVPDPHSPFAKLAQLRNRLENDKTATPLKNR
ncbi:hypothetical protein [Bartonella ancashensis]|uniref:ATP-dependent DNA helicase n=1 Tax=Bartonella ancashensis TaxID=1318743 RepID=A0A0M5KWT5_9HYPH|nr:hypothetical protein [Bartonella ancashensis]ALE03148.1 ATP-dependent DNA helicase [Bartonella ancashensis]